ncbi:MAG: rod shape-determining protein MreC [Candidatus Omnitrophica bacterium]|nr:rod shape-determining protein MreC [Candidatus Omnitrophota bacterium]
MSFFQNSINHLLIKDVLKLKNKNLIYAGAVACLFLFFAILIPVLRAPVLTALRYPLNLSALLKREVRGIIFYHRNFTQNERLKDQVDFLKQKINAMEEISAENARLKRLFSFKQNSPYKVIACRVIGRSPDNWSSVIIIDKGRYSGIKEGMVVINYLGLVGRVIETAKNASKVVLINDPNFAVSAIDKRSRQEGLVCGTLGASLTMKYLPGDADIAVSDSVITSGLSGLYPKGLLIGSVTAVGEEFSGLSRYAVIKPAVNLSDIEEVLVIAQ